MGGKYDTQKRYGRHPKTELPQEIGKRVFNKAVKVLYKKGLIVKDDQISKKGQDLLKSPEVQNVSSNPGINMASKLSHAYSSVHHGYKKQEPQYIMDTYGLTDLMEPNYDYKDASWTSYKTDVPYEALVVMAVIPSMYNEASTKKAFSDIKKDTSLKDKDIQAALNYLVEKGYIEPTQPNGVPGKSTQKGADFSYKLSYGLEWPSGSSIGYSFYLRDLERKKKNFQKINSKYYKKTEPSKSSSSDKLSEDEAIVLALYNAYDKTRASFKATRDLGFTSEEFRKISNKLDKDDFVMGSGAVTDKGWAFLSNEGKKVGRKPENPEPLVAALYVNSSRFRKNKTKSDAPQSQKLDTKLSWLDAIVLYAIDMHKDMARSMLYDAGIKGHNTVAPQLKEKGFVQDAPGGYGDTFIITPKGKSELEKVSNYFVNGLGIQSFASDKLLGKLKSIKKNRKSFTQRIVQPKKKEHKYKVSWQEAVVALLVKETMEAQREKTAKGHGFGDGVYQSVYDSLRKSGHIGPTGGLTSDGQELVRRMDLDLDWRMNYDLSTDDKIKGIIKNKNRFAKKNHKPIAQQTTPTPVKKKPDLSWEETVVLIAVNGIKSFARVKEALSDTSINEQDYYLAVEELKKKRLLKSNGAMSPSGLKKLDEIMTMLDAEDYQSSGRFRAVEANKSMFNKLPGARDGATTKTKDKYSSGDLSWEEKVLLVIAAGIRAKFKKSKAQEMGIPESKYNKVFSSLKAQGLLAGNGRPSSNGNLALTRLQKKYGWPVYGATKQLEYLAKDKDKPSYAKSSAPELPKDTVIKDPSKFYAEPPKDMTWGEKVVLLIANSPLARSKKKADELLKEKGFKDEEYKKAQKSLVKRGLLNERFYITESGRMLCNWLIDKGGWDRNDTVQHVNYMTLAKDKPKHVGGYYDFLKGSQAEPLIPNLSGVSLQDGKRAADKLNLVEKLVLIYLSEFLSPSSQSSVMKFMKSKGMGNTVVDMAKKSLAKKDLVSLETGKPTALGTVASNSFGKEVKTSNKTEIVKRLYDKYAGTPKEPKDTEIGTSKGTPIKLDWHEIMALAVTQLYKPKDRKEQAAAHGSGEFEDARNSLIKKKLLSSKGGMLKKGKEALYSTANQKGYNTTSPFQLVKSIANAQDKPKDPQFHEISWDEARKIARELTWEQKVAIVTASERNTPKRDEITKKMVEWGFSLSRYRKAYDELKTKKLLNQHGQMTEIGSMIPIVLNKILKSTRPSGKISSLLLDEKNRPNYIKNPHETSGAPKEPETPEVSPPRGKPKTDLSFEEYLALAAASGLKAGYRKKLVTRDAKITDDQYQMLLDSLKGKGLLNKNNSLSPKGKQEITKINGHYGIEHNSYNSYTVDDRRGDFKKFNFPAKKVDIVVEPVAAPGLPGQTMTRAQQIQNNLANAKLMNLTWPEKVALVVSSTHRSSDWEKATAKIGLPKDELDKAFSSLQRKRLMKSNKQTTEKGMIQYITLKRQNNWPTDGPTMLRELGKDPNRPKFADTKTPVDKKSMKKVMDIKTYEGSLTWDEVVVLAVTDEYKSTHRVKNADRIGLPKAHYAKAKASCISKKLLNKNGAINKFGKATLEQFAKSKGWPETMKISRLQDDPNKPKYVGTTGLRSPITKQTSSGASKMLSYGEKAVLVIQSLVALTHRKKVAIKLSNIDSETFEAMLNALESKGFVNAVGAPTPRGKMAMADIAQKYNEEGYWDLLKALYAAKKSGKEKTLAQVTPKPTGELPWEQKVALIAIDAFGSKDGRKYARNFGGLKLGGFGIAQLALIKDGYLTKSRKATMNGQKEITKVKRVLRYSDRETTNDLLLKLKKKGRINGEKYFDPTSVTPKDDQPKQMWNPSQLKKAITDLDKKPIEYGIVAAFRLEKNPMNREKMVKIIASVRAMEYRAAIKSLIKKGILLNDKEFSANGHTLSAWLFTQRQWKPENLNLILDGVAKKLGRNKAADPGMMDKGNVVPIGRGKVNQKTLRALKNGLTWEENYVLGIVATTRKLRPNTRFKTAQYYIKFPQAEFDKAIDSLKQKGYLTSRESITSKGKLVVKNIAKSFGTETNLQNYQWVLTQDEVRPRKYRYHGVEMGNSLKRQFNIIESVEPDDNNMTTGGMSSGDVGYSENYDLDDYPDVDESYDLDDYPDVDESYDLDDYPDVDESYDLDDYPDVDEEYYDDEHSSIEEEFDSIYNEINDDDIDEKMGYPGYDKQQHHTFNYEDDEEYDDDDEYEDDDDDDVDWKAMYHNLLKRRGEHPSQKQEKMGHPQYKVPVAPNSANAATHQTFQYEDDDEQIQEKMGHPQYQVPSDPESTNAATHQTFQYGESTGFQMPQGFPGYPDESQVAKQESVAHTQAKPVTAMIPGFGEFDDSGLPVQVSSAPQMPGAMGGGGSSVDSEIANINQQISNIPAHLVDQSSLQTNNNAAPVQQPMQINMGQAQQQQPQQRQVVVNQKAIQEGNIIKNMFKQSLIDVNAINQNLMANRCKPLTESQIHTISNLNSQKLDFKTISHQTGIPARTVKIVIGK